VIHKSEKRVKSGSLPFKRRVKLAPCADQRAKKERGERGGTGKKGVSDKWMLCRKGGSGGCSGVGKKQEAESKGSKKASVPE